MLGDMAPIFGPPQVRAMPTGSNVLRLPWVRGYKMADNQSPRPLDRVFVAFNFYDDLNVGSDGSPRVPLGDVRVWREFFGLEKTFLEQQASIGLRLPLNTISAEGRGPGVGGTSTALGDLTVFLKYAPWLDPISGDVFSAGLAVTAPTSPRAFAGADFTRARNPTYLQPFIGYIKTWGDWYIQGFSGINVPSDSRVVTMYYNDFGLGYYLYRSPKPRAMVSALVPSIEVHVNTPLNHRGGFSAVRDPGATFDVVNLTFGLNTILRQRTVLSVGFVEPLTGPRPFDFEVVVLLNVYYNGRRPGRPVPGIRPPSIGG